MFKPRIFTEMLVFFLAFLSLFFEQDLGFLVILDYLLIRPVLISSLLFFILWRVFDLFRGRAKKNLKKRFLSILYIALLLLFLAFGFIFSEEIVYLRELAFFNWNRDGFDEVIRLKDDLSHCMTSTEVVCEEFLEYPNGTWGAGKDIRAYAYDGVYIITVYSRPSAVFIYMPGQDSIPTSKSAGRYSFGCDYQLSAVWFICSIGT